MLESKIKSDIPGEKAASESLKKRKLKSSVKSESCPTIGEMLDARNMSALCVIAEPLKIRGYRKLRKSELIVHIIQKLTDPEVLVETLIMLSSSAWTLFIKTVDVEYLTEDKIYQGSYFSYLSLNHLGLLGVYHNNDGQIFYALPNEIKSAYREIEKTGFPAEKAFYDLLSNYAAAATHLYGVIKQDDFVELFNSQNKRKTTEDELCNILTKLAVTDNGYRVQSGYIISDEFGKINYENVEHYAQTASSKPRYVPPADIFLKYADRYYLGDAPKVDELRTYIVKNLGFSSDMAEYLLERIHGLCLNGINIQGHIELLKYHGASVDNAQQQELQRLLMKFHNSTRLWFNNGHTPDEIFWMEHKHTQASQGKSAQAFKIGRNSPCPCGSGKKYKKCCGK